MGFNLIELRVTELALLNDVEESAVCEALPIWTAR
jgi:hypothetical protein